MSERSPRILVVDDEPAIRRSCVKILTRMDYTVETAGDGREALERITADPADVVITDLKMSRMGGMELLREVREHYPETMVIVITGYASVSSSVEVMKTGAFDYLPKPFTPHELRSVVVQALSERDRIVQNRRLRRQPEQQAGRGGGVKHQLIGDSPKIKTVVSMVGKVAPTDATVLIYGESGTGKELIARAIHANSNRRDDAFFAVDCGTLSEDLLETELFGHVRGAFTGAHRDKAGIFALADGGTVFLDEISNISREVQGKLLRFLEVRELMPVGATEVREVDVRLIFATNRDLKEMVASGAFREDFYYRIYVYPIHLPPIRERPSDILPIAYHFLNGFSESVGKRISGFDETAARRLTEYHWPGNVRQLRNVVERAVILCEGEWISRADLPALGDSDGADPPADDVPETNEALKAMKKEVREHAVRRVERRFLLNALTQADWNVTQAARRTGMQRTQFQRLMKKHDITAPDR